MAIKTSQGTGFEAETHIGKAGDILTSIDNVQLGSGNPESIGDKPTLSNYTAGDIQATCITVQPPNVTAGFSNGGVAIGDSRIFVGQYNYNNDVGAVFMFSFEGDYLGRIDAPETSIGDDTGFGWGVICVDGLLIVHSNDYDNDPNAYDNGATELEVGRTYVYDQMGNLLRTLPIPSTLYSSSDAFGMAAAAGCGRIVVGRQRASGNYRFTPPGGDPGVGSFQGNATIYDYNGNIICPNILWKNEMEYYSTTSANEFGNADPMVYDYDRPAYSASFGGRTYGGGSQAQQAVGCGKIVICSQDDSIFYSPNQAAVQANMGTAYMFDLNGNFEKILFHPWQTNYGSSLQTSIKLGADVRIGSGRIVIDGQRVDNPSQRNMGAKFVFDMDGNYLWSLVGARGGALDSDSNRSYQLVGLSIYGGLIMTKVLYPFEAAADTGAPTNTEDYKPYELHDINGRYIDTIYPEDMAGNTSGAAFGSEAGASKFAMGYGIFVHPNTWNTTDACINIFKIPTTYDGLIEKSTGVTQN